MEEMNESPFFLVFFSRLGSLEGGLLLLRLDRFKRLAIKVTIRTITSINERVESDSDWSLARSFSTRLSVAVTSILSIVIADFPCLAFR